MKIAIGSTGKDSNSKASEVFARCPYFVIAEIKDGKVQKTEIVENMSANQLGQAGVSAAQLMAEKDVKAVIAKNIGPRASDALRQFNIAIYYGDGVVKNVLQEFIDGKLEKFQ